MEFAVCGKPTRRVRCFEDENTLAAFRQVGSANQAVVPGPDDDRVVSIHYTCLIVLVDQYVR
jgi:hypothetical protein